LVFPGKKILALVVIITTYEALLPENYHRLGLFGLGKFRCWYGLKKGFTGCGRKFIGEKKFFVFWY
jgi:hypothetical protein